VNTETISQEYADLDTWPAERMLQAIISSSQRSVDAVAAALPELTRAAELIGQRLGSGGRLIYIGAGTSGRLALQDAAELPPTFGFDRTLVLLAGGSFAGSQAREGAEDHEEAARQEISAADVNEHDAVIGIAASGRTPYTIAGIRAARERGALTVGLANNAGSALLLAAEVPVLLETGPEVLAGSTRLAAGTAQKIALGALSTTALVSLGGAYGNLMVGMNPGNEKLRQRAAVIVAEATGLDEGEAAGQLEAAGWDIKTAIVMLKAQVDAARARELLAGSGGRVRQAIAAAG
jgi:N-acetylmuramic acid 6-phosphate etherase